MLDIKKKLGQLQETLFFCFGLSWKISKVYVIIRLVAKTLIPLNIVFLSIIGKLIINMLIDKNNYYMIIYMLAAISILRLINTIFNGWNIVTMFKILY